MLVSSAIVVVITRVTPSMLPPTIITAPTSAIARPNPASSTVASEKRVSHSSVSAAREVLGAKRCQLLAVLAPGIGDDLPRQRRDDRRDQDRLGDDHRRRREQDAERAERPGARQQQIDDQPDDDRRQSHHRVQDDRQRLPAGEAADGDRGAERQPHAGRDERRREADAQRQLDDRQQLRVEMRDEGQRQRKLSEKVFMQSGDCKVCIRTAFLGNSYMSSTPGLDAASSPGCRPSDGKRQMACAQPRMAEALDVQRRPAEPSRQVPVKLVARAVEARRMQSGESPRTPLRDPSGRRTRRRARARRDRRPRVRTASAARRPARPRERRSAELADHRQRRLPRRRPRAEPPGQRDGQRAAEDARRPRPSDWLRRGS